MFCQQTSGLEGREKREIIPSVGVKSFVRLKELFKYLTFQLFEFSTNHLPPSISFIDRYIIVSYFQ